MKEVLALRHAKSSWAEPGLADHDRPLDGRGERDAPEMGRRLTARDLVPERLLSSTARRARQTAEAVAGAMGLGADRLATDDRLYLAAPEEILAVLQETDDAIARLLFVAHNPGIHSFAHHFGGLDVGKFPTAALARIQWPTNHWSEIGSQPGRLLLYDFPHNHDN